MPPSLLRLGQDMLRKGRLARGFRPKDLNNTPTWHTTDTEAEIQSDRPGWNRLDVHLGDLAQAHDCALAKLAVDLCHGCFKGLVAIRLLSCNGHVFSPFVERTF